jgi:hypothetical protein
MFLLQPKIASTAAVTATFVLQLQQKQQQYCCSDFITVKILIYMNDKQKVVWICISKKKKNCIQYFHGI